MEYRLILSQLFREYSQRGISDIQSHRKEKFCHSTGGNTLKTILKCDEKWYAKHRDCRCLVKKNERHRDSSHDPCRALGVKEEQLCRLTAYLRAWTAIEARERYNAYHLGEVALWPDSRKDVWCLKSSPLRLPPHHADAPSYDLLKKEKSRIFSARLCICMREYIAALASSCTSRYEGICYERNSDGVQKYKRNRVC